MWRRSPRSSSGLRRAVGIALTSDALDIAACPASQIAARLRQWQLASALRCYHADLHPALFTHPRHLQAIFDSAGGSK